MYLSALVLFSVLAVPTVAAAQSVSFHQISIGEPIASLPFSCAPIICNSIVDGDYISLMTLDSQVLNFDVIYEGMTFTKEPIHAAPITLAQAIKRHSMASDAATPVLRFARDNSEKIYGLVDVRNRITYQTEVAPSQTPAQLANTKVSVVTYLSPSAPILEASHQESLRGAESTLLSAAADSATYSPIARLQNTATSGASTPYSSRKPTPFGFGRGMTKAEVLKLVGNRAVKKEDEDSLMLTAAPKGYPDFELYHLIFSPKAGLLKLVAISKDVDSDAYGDELRSKFSSIKQALTETYGTGKELEYLHDGSIWNERRDWMMGLTKKERTLAVYWDFGTGQNGLSDVVLEARGLNSDTGYLSLAYEFEGWSDHVDQVTKKKESVF